MEKWIENVLKVERKKRKIPLEVKVLNKNHYLYNSTTRWDKAEKKVKKVTKYIGRITPQGVIECRENSRTIHEYGNSKILYDVAEEILKPLEESFVYRWKEVLACAIVKTIQPLPLKLIKSRWEKLHLSQIVDASVSPNTLSDVLREVGKDYASQKRFFDSLMSKSKFLAFDLSSIFSHSENLHYAEKGYNPDHVYLKQINFMMFFSIDKQLPVMMKPLYGSIRDIKALKEAIDDVDAKNSIVVLDRGFASYGTPEMLSKKHFSFILPLRRNFKIINYGKKLENYFIYRKRGIKWSKWKKGNNFLYVFEDVKLRSEEETTFIHLMEDKKRTESEYLQELKKFGKISLLSDRDIKGEEIYLMYKQREDVESAFDALKNELENDKTYLGDDDAVRGYFFISFLSLYLHYKVLKMLKEKKLSDKISVNELLLELSKVYQITLGQKKSLNSIPAKVEKLISILKLDINPKNLGS